MIEPNNKDREAARAIVASLSYENLASIGDELHCWRGKAGDLIPIDLLNRRIAETQTALELVAVAAYARGRDEAKAEDGKLAASRNNPEHGQGDEPDDATEKWSHGYEVGWNDCADEIASAILTPASGPTVEQRLSAENDILRTRMASLLFSGKFDDITSDIIRAWAEEYPTKLAIELHQANERIVEAIRQAKIETLDEVGAPCSTRSPAPDARHIASLIADELNLSLVQRESVASIIEAELGEAQ